MNLEAEQALLGAALTDTSVVNRLVERLSENDFMKSAHRIIWATLVSLSINGEATDPVTAAAKMTTEGTLNKVGGASYLHTLYAAAVLPAQAEHYARLIIDQARRRNLNDLGTRLQQVAKGDADTSDAIAIAKTWLEETDKGPHWPSPLPLGDTEQTLPSFPVDVLPDWVAQMASGVAEFTQTPVDLAGCIALAALSTACGGRAVVEVRGSWREPVNLYLAVVLPPGSRKSAVFDTITSPLLAAEAELAKHAGPIIADAKLRLEIATKAAERSKAAVASATDEGTRTTLLAEATAAAMDAEAITIPPRPRLVADDITPEAAASLLADQGGRLAVLSAEGGIFATLAGRYSGTPNLEVFLKGHAGDMLRVDRKHDTPAHIEHPALTLGLAIQPELLREIATMPGFRGRGLLARILFALPRSTVGKRRIAPPPAPAVVTETYALHLGTLVATLADWTDPAVLPLTEEANQAVIDIETTVEPRLGDQGMWASIIDWGAKYTGAVVRIAGLLHLAEHYRDGWAKPIPASTIHGAAQLGEYFAVHALAAFTHMGTDSVTEAAQTILTWITRTRAERFSKRDLFNALPRSQFRRVAALSAPLQLLEQHGYLHQISVPSRHTAGRPPSPLYLTHPTIHKGQ